jgi:hypothetical protein
MKNSDIDTHRSNKENILRYIIIITPGILILLVLGFLYSRRIETARWFCPECGDCVITERHYFTWQELPPVREYKVVQSSKTILSDILKNGSSCTHEGSFVCDFSPHIRGTTYRNLRIVGGEEKNMLGQRILFFTGVDSGYYFDFPNILKTYEESTPRGKMLVKLLREKKRSDPAYITTLKKSFIEMTYGDNIVWKTLMQDLETSMTQAGGGI